MRLAEMVFRSLAARMLSMIRIYDASTSGGRAEGNIGQNSAYV